MTIDFTPLNFLLVEIDEFPSKNAFQKYGKCSGLITDVFKDDDGLFKMVLFIDRLPRGGVSLTEPYGHKLRYFLEEKIVDCIYKIRKIVLDRTWFSSMLNELWGGFGDDNMFDPKVSSNCAFWWKDQDNYIQVHRLDNPVEDPKLEHVASAILNTYLATCILPEYTERRRLLYKTVDKYHNLATTGVRHG